MIEFINAFGNTGGGRTRSFWDYRIGHILPAISRDNVGTLKPEDLLGAVSLFDSKFEAE